MTSPECRRCESPLESGDLRCAICGLPTATPALGGAAASDEVVAAVLRCNGCGAAVAYRAERQAPHCDFCDAVMEVETPEDPIGQAEAFVPFGVSSVQAREALAAWLGSRGFFRPSDLHTEAKIREPKPLYWAAWVFDADVVMSWAADSDAGSRRSDWAPHAGQEPLAMRRVVVPASQGLSVEECAALIPRYDLAGATPQPEAAWGHATVEQFVLRRSAAREQVARALRDVAAARAAERIPGSTHRNLRVEVLPTRLETRHLVFPAHVLAYRYRDRVYRAIVHGQDPSCVIGQAPLSVARIVAVVVAVVTVAVVIAMLVTK